jgi:hypothetical protein
MAGQTALPLEQDSIALSGPEPGLPATAQRDTISAKQLAWCRMIGLRKLARSLAPFVLAKDRRSDDSERATPAPDDMADDDIAALARSPELLSEEEAAVAGNIRTILIPLGPYRNLTTLIGAILSLHPQAVVLNHAAARLLDHVSIDFLARPTRDAQRRFLAVGVRLLQGGKPGDHGGSILKSHVFGDPAMRALYRERYGRRLLKPDARLLYWKDSQRIENHLRKDGISLPELCDRLDNVKFLLPIRNPIDCAKSNLRTGLWRRIPGVQRPDFEELLIRILLSFKWTMTHPVLTAGRLLVIWQFDLLTTGLADLCRFCDIDVDDSWISTVSSHVRVKERTATEEERKIYRHAVAAVFGELPHLRDGLLRYVA